MAEFLMTPDQNPKGRGFVQDGTTLYVMSECCSAAIELKQKPGEHWTLPPWASCSVCNAWLEQNHERWKTCLDKIDRLNEDVRDEGTYWNDWGLFWFGLKGFGMKVEE